MTIEPSDSWQDPPAPAEATDTADRLHSAAIHLLRRLRVHDAAAGLTASRLSALSVVVFGGPLRIGDLAAAEQVRPPSMTRTVADLERAGLVRRRDDRRDRRAQLLEATDRGRRLLDEGRTRRVEALARELAALPEPDRAVLRRAADLLERLSMPSAHPLQDGRGPRPDAPVNT